MNFHTFFAIVAANAVLTVDAVSIDYDKVHPFAQPEAVTTSEKETSGGLKPTGGTGDCKDPPLGSQVYGRTAWYNGVWAIMYAWYFPKGFWISIPSRRFDWASAVVWIDNPALESPKIMGLSMSRSDTKYKKETQLPGWSVANNTTVKLHRSFSVLVGPPYLEYTIIGGDSQDLIMWDQLTDDTRTALNDSSNFGNAEVLFNDENFQTMLEKAFPF